MTTYYIGPGGSDAANGLSFANRKLTFDTTFNNLLSAGDTAMFVNGLTQVSTTRFLARSGTAGNPITYQASVTGSDGIQWTGAINTALIQMGSNVANYLDFRGMLFDCNSLALEAILVNPTNFTHHIGFYSNTVKNSTSAGFATSGGDYFTVIGNKFYKCGDVSGGTGFSSAVSINNNVNNSPYDTYRGFHHVVARNFISGGFDSSTNHTDGNGIILDRNVGNALVCDNVIWNNGGRAIVSLNAAANAQHWIVNNTSYKNALDLSLSSSGISSEYLLSSSTGSPGSVYFANNVGYAWQHATPANRAVFQQSGSDFLNVDSSKITYRANVGYYFSPAVLATGIPSSVTTDATRMTTADPLFVSPPTIDDVNDRQYDTATSPDNIGGAFHLQPGSTIKNTGVDPRNFATIPEITSDLTTYALTDADGKSR